MHPNEIVSKCEALEICYDAVTHAASQLLEMIHGVDPDNAKNVADVLQRCMVDWDGHCEDVHDCVQSINETVLEKCSQDFDFSEDDVVMLSEHPECGCYHVSAIGLPNRSDPCVYTVLLSRIERVECDTQNSAKTSGRSGRSGWSGWSGWVSAENPTDLMLNGDKHQLGLSIRRHPGKFRFSRAQLDACALKIVNAVNISELKKIVARIIQTDARMHRFNENSGRNYLETSIFKSSGYSVAGRDHVIALALMDHMAPLFYPRYDFNESDLVRVKFSDEKNARVVVFVNIDVVKESFCYLDGESFQIIFNGHGVSIPMHGIDDIVPPNKSLSKITSMSLVIGKDIHGLDCSGPAEAVLLCVYAQKENLRMRIGRFSEN